LESKVTGEVGFSISSVIIKDAFLENPSEELEEW
jgi:hypothetical protein